MLVDQPRSPCNAVFSKSAAIEVQDIVSILRQWEVIAAAVRGSRRVGGLRCGMADPRLGYLSVLGHALNWIVQSGSKGSSRDT